MKEMRQKCMLLFVLFKMGFFGDQGYFNIVIRIGFRLGVLKFISNSLISVGREEQEDMRVFNFDLVLGGWELRFEE